MASECCMPILTFGCKTILCLWLYMSHYIAFKVFSYQWWHVSRCFSHKSPPSFKPTKSPFFVPFASGCYWESTWSWTCAYRSTLWTLQRVPYLEPLYHPHVSWLRAARDTARRKGLISLTESVTRLQEVWPEASIAMWYPCTDPQQRRSVKLRLEDARRSDKIDKLQCLKQDFTPFFNITRSLTDMLIWNTQYSKFSDLMLGFAEVLVYLLEFILVVVMRNHLKRSFRIWSWSWIVVF